MSTLETTTYTQAQVDIEILKCNDNHLYKTLDRIELNQTRLLGVVCSGFVGMLGLIAHGFKWII